jgi:hypothetical protein
VGVRHGHACTWHRRRGGARAAIPVEREQLGDDSDRRSDVSIRARAPVRQGLAAEIPTCRQYCDDYGGAVLNATIGRYAYAHLSFRNDHKLCFSAMTSIIGHSFTGG